MSNDDNLKYRPWEEETGKKKKKGKLRGIPHKTAIKSQVASRPGAESHEYLNIFVLLKEKERMEQYGELLSQRHESVIKEWNALKEKLIGLEKELPKISDEEIDQPPGKQARWVTTKKMKNMKPLEWNY